MADCDRAHTIDYTEWELASVQLDALALAHEGVPWAAWKEAVLDWHLQTLAGVRREGWIPGLAGCQDDDQVLKKFLSRFYLHHSDVTIRRLRQENAELQRKVIDAADWLRFYAGGATDTGRRAAMGLRSLLSRSTRASPANLTHFPRR